MQLALSFNDLLEAVDQLTLAEQESLVDILRRRLVEKRRAELLQEVQSARQEYQRNQVQAATADVFEFVEHEGAEAILLETIGSHDEVY